MSMYWTGTLLLQRKAPTGMRWAMTITLLTCGEIRSGVCGQRGSGGKALSVLALAIPTRSAPSALARALTIAATIGSPRRSSERPARPPAQPQHRATDLGRH